MRRFALACLGILLAAAGCAGKSGTEESVTVQILSTSPADGATGVSVRATTITAIADRDLDPLSVNASTVFVHEGGVGGLVQGTVSYSAATRTITWRLAPGQGLNPQLPGEDVFAFDELYTLTLENLRSTLQQPMARRVRATFETAPLGYTVVAAGSDPQPGAADALIDPYLELVSGRLIQTTVKFQIDVPLEPASVTSAASVFVTTRILGVISPVDGTVDFDPPTNTIFWSPTATASAHPGFPGEPLLDTGTAYILTVSDKVKSLAGNLAPAGDLEIRFTTAPLAIRTPRALPAGVTTGADILLNEVFPNPATSTATGDSNDDGLFNENQDEFVEIVNGTAHYLDMSGLEIRDATSTNIVLALPSAAGQRHRAFLAPGRAIVAFGGGTPSSARLAVGRSKVFAGARAPGSSSAVYNNGTTSQPGSVVDTVRVIAVSGGITTATHMVADYLAPVPNGSSLVRNPDVTGPLTDHATVTPGVNFTPGTRVNGRPFP